MKDNEYSQTRLRLINEYNINLIMYIVDLFADKFGQELSHFEKFRVCKKEDNITSVVEFCQLFYGVSNLEWVQIHFKSGLYISLTAHAQVFEIWYKAPGDKYTDRIRTSKLNPIRNFLIKHKLI